MVSTVKVSWSFNFNLIEEFGFEETANFSATFSPIEFYLRLTKDAQLSLRLATCPQEKLHIDKFKVEANRYQVVNEGRTTHCRTRLSGGNGGQGNADRALSFSDSIPFLFCGTELTLDRSSKLSWQLPYLNNWKVDCKITYEEPLAMVHHRLKLADHLAAFRLNDAHTDVTLVTVDDGEEHSANKLILSLRSPVFAAMFKHQGVVENVLNRVEIEGVSGDAMMTFLDYVYSGDISTVHWCAAEVFELANKVRLSPET